MNILVVAPHPDDETLGCGGTLLKLAQQGASIHWLIFTEMTADTGFSSERIKARNDEIASVAAAYKFAGVHRLRFATTRLDAFPMRDLIVAASGVMKAANPQIMFLPFSGDIHSDHDVVFRTMSACTKSFNYPNVKRVLCYEALSETDFGIDPAVGFRPNSFCDISGTLEEKTRIMGMYAGEMKPNPFPRSMEALRALATTRGVVAGCAAAEAFMILKEIW
ncbi:MAG TPA: PIG-L family deacetylase [Rhizomicrobium sp.]